MHTPHLTRAKRKALGIPLEPVPLTEEQIAVQLLKAKQVFNLGAVYNASSGKRPTLSAVNDSMRVDISRFFLFLPSVSVYNLVIAQELALFQESPSVQKSATVAHPNENCMSIHFPRLDSYIYNDRIAVDSAPCFAGFPPKSHSMHTLSEIRRFPATAPVTTHCAACKKANVPPTSLGPTQFLDDASMQTVTSRIMSSLPVEVDDVLASLIETSDTSSTSPPTLSTEVDDVLASIVEPPTSSTPVSSCTPLPICALSTEVNDVLSSMIEPVTVSTQPAVSTFINPTIRLLAIEVDDILASVIGPSTSSATASSCISPPICALSMDVDDVLSSMIDPVTASTQPAVFRGIPPTMPPLTTEVDDVLASIVEPLTRSTVMSSCVSIPVSALSMEVDDILSSIIEPATSSTQSTVPGYITPTTDRLPMEVDDALALMTKLPDPSSTAQPSLPNVSFESFTKILLQQTAAAVCCLLHSQYLNSDYLSPVQPKDQIEIDPAYLTQVEQNEHSLPTCIAETETQCMSSDQVSQDQLTSNCIWIKYGTEAEDWPYSSCCSL